MSPQSVESLPRPTLASVLGASFRLQTYRNLLYLVLAFPLGLAYFVFIAVGLSLGVGLAVTVVGIPILLTVLAVATGLGTVERKLTTLLLGVDIEPPDESHLRLADERPVTERVRSFVTAAETWKAVCYLASKLVFGVVSFGLIMSLLVTAVSLLAVPFVYNQPNVYVGLSMPEPATLHPTLSYGWDTLAVGIESVVRLSSWQVTTLPEALLVASLGVGLVVFALNVLNALAWVSGRYARFMLGRTEDGADAVADGAAVE